MAARGSLAEAPKKRPAPTTVSTSAVDANAYWSIPANELLGRLETSPSGLSASGAASRLAKCGRNTPTLRSDATALGLFAQQFRSPLVLILVFAAIVSTFVGSGNEAAIIGAIVLASCVLSFTQEYGASRATAALKQRISRKAIVFRGGVECTVDAEDIVPGDLIRLSAGNLIPTDGVILEARDFNVSEAVLTGEAFPLLINVKSSSASQPGRNWMWSHHSGNNCDLFDQHQRRSGRDGF